MNQRPKHIRIVTGVGTRLLDYIDTHVCPRVALEVMVRS